MTTKKTKKMSGCLPGRRGLRRPGRILLAFAAFVTLFAVTVSVFADDEITLESFAHSRIGVVTGATQAEMAAEMFPEADIRYFSGLQEVNAALDAGQIDCTITPFFSAIQYLKEFSNFSVLDEHLYPCPMAPAFAKTPEADALRKEVNEYIASIRADGTLEALEAHWYTEELSGQMFEKEDLGPGEHRKLIIATSGTFVPFSFMSEGKPSGFDIDFLTGFCNAYGYDYELQLMNFESILMAVTMGQCDFACSHLSVTEERKESVNFSDPYSSSYNVLMYKTGETRRHSLRESFEKTFVRERRWLLIVNGLLVTLLITLVSAVLGTVLAALLCLLRAKGGKFGEGFAEFFVRIFQGTPILVILLLFYYVVFAHTGASAVFVAVVVFSLNSAAFFSESIMSGIRAVPPAQTEAALALGFNEKQAFRFCILPQAAAHFLPVYRGELISLLKGTSIVGYIAIQDLTKAGDLIRSRTFEALFPLLVIALIYFFLSWLLFILAGVVEKKLKPVYGGHHLAGVKLREEDPA